MALKETLKQKIEEFRPRTTKLTKEFGKIVIDQVTIDQAIGGARDVRCLVTDISYLDPQEGIRFRGKTIPETFEALPKAPGSNYPTVESFWYFLLTGEVPTQAQVDEVVAEWKTRQAVPQPVALRLVALGERRRRAQPVHPRSGLRRAIERSGRALLHRDRDHAVLRREIYERLVQLLSVFRRDEPSHHGRRRP